MFDIRLREFSPTGVRGRVIPALKIDATDAESATGRLTFQTSERVAGRLDAPFVVGLEETHTGQSWSRPRNDLFIVLQDAENAADQAGVMQFTAQSYLGWLLSQGILWWNWDSKDDRTRVFNMTPGRLMRLLVEEAQGLVATVQGPRGWAPFVGFDFTDTHDSLGNPWKPEDQIDMSLALWRPMSSFIQSWVEQGHFEWWAEGTTLRLARVGSGVDRSDTVVFGGPAFSDAPAKTDFQGTFTSLVIIPDGAIATAAANPGADTRFGALETSMTLSGVNDQATAIRQAQPLMSERRSKRLELSYDWSPAAGGPVPGRDFDIGDLVMARRKSSKQPQRVIGIQRFKTGTEVTVRAIVGSKLVGLQAKLAKRVGSVSQGAIIGGSGDSIPSNPGVQPNKPAMPNALRVASNVARWRDDRVAVAAVTLAWDQVTTDPDGNPIGVDLYEIASRLPAGTPQSETTTAGAMAVVSSWEPDVLRLVSVRARSVSGVWSDWSGEISVTPAMPASIVPKPVVGLAVASNTAVFVSDGRSVATVAFSWSAVAQSTDSTPVEVAEYELSYGGETQRVTGLTASVQVPSLKGVTVKVRALSTLGVWGDYSTPLTVTGATPAVLSGVPTKPVLTTGQGIVAYAWGGLLTTGAPGAGLNGVEAQFALVAAGPWEPVGGLISAGGGGGVIKGLAGQEVFVRYRTKDTLGRPGGWSAVASIVVTAVGAGDIDQVILDAITQAQSDATAAGTAAATAQSAAGSAQTTATAAQGAASTAQSAANQAAADALAAAGIANGKGKVIYQVSAPTGANANANNLWIRTSDNKPHTYNGTTWLAVTDKAATDAAAAAATADGKAVTAKQAADAAQAKADQAFANAAAAATAAGNAQASADGKNRVWYQTAPPAGTGHKVNDIWFDTDNGNAIAYWTGTAWGAAPLGTAAIQDAAITNAKIANLDAAKITTGFLAAARIAANSLSATKMLITSLENIVQDFSFEYNSTEAWVPSGGASNDTVNPRTGARALKIPTTTAAFIAATQQFVFSVTPGEKYRLSAWVRVDSGVSAGQGITLRMRWGAAEGNATTASADTAVTPAGTGTTYVQIKGEWEVPAAARFARLDIVNRDVVTGKVYRVDDVELYKMTAGELIVDGSILTRHLKAEEIWANTAWIDLATVNVLRAGVVKVDMLEPNIGDKLNLSGNGALVQIGGQLNQTQADLSVTNQAVGNADAKADAAMSAATQAQGTALGAVSANATTAALAQATAQALTAHKSIFQVTSDGGRFVTPDGSNALVLTPVGVAIQQNGIASTTWTAGRMVVPEAVVEAATIAGLRFEKSGTRTLVKAAS